MLSKGASLIALSIGSIMSRKDGKMWIECPECGGEGRCEYEVAVPDPMAWRGGELQGRIMECEMCSGSGEIEIEDEDED